VALRVVLHPSCKTEPPMDFRAVLHEAFEHAEPRAVDAVQVLIQGQGQRGRQRHFAALALGCKHGNSSHTLKKIKCDHAGCACKV